MVALFVDKLATLPVRLPANEEAVTIPRFRLALVPVKLAALPVRLPTIVPEAVISAADISLTVRSVAVISLTVISSVFFNVTLPVLP